MDLAKNIETAKLRIKEAAKKAGRTENDIRLIVVTKTIPAEMVNEAIRLGIGFIGENRVQEAEDKFLKLNEVKKHLIGHLQTNKAKKAVELFDCIQSVDSLKLAEEIDKRASEKNKVMEIFIEVNIGREQQKTGIMPEDVFTFYDRLLKLQNIKVNGIMCIPPFMEAEKCRPYFIEMRKLKERLNVKWLSMGMSNDFEAAIEEGSNMVRLGRAIFGDRIRAV
jgi:pyridoxal phosphate enzyme (YggS family)